MWILASPSKDNPKQFNLHILRLCKDKPSLKDGKKYQRKHDNKLVWVPWHRFFDTKTECKQL